jgi:Holliday junction resolvase RusA-like endonuclease
MIKIRVEETPPNKSNSYRLGNGRFYVGPAVKAFESRLRSAAQQALRAEGFAATIVIPAPTAADLRKQAQTGRPVQKQPKVTGPFFTGDLVVQVRIGRPGAAGIDVDGVKAVLDGINQSGIWADDRQVAVLRISRETSVDPFTEVSVDPFHSPMVMPRRDWWDITKKKREERQSMRQRWAEEVVIQVFCARCSVGIGQNTARAEAWYWPALQQDQEVLRFCCEECAEALGFPTSEPWRQLSTVREQERITAAEIIRRGCLLRQERKLHAEPRPT